MILSVTLLNRYLINLIKASVARLTVLALGLHEDAGRREFGLAFDRGQDVEFGAVILSREGINLEDCIIPWSALRSFRASKGEIVFVRQFGNRFESRRVSASKVRHLPEMLHLLETQFSAKQYQLTH